MQAGTQLNFFDLPPRKRTLEHRQPPLYFANLHSVHAPKVFVTTLYPTAFTSQQHYRTVTDLVCSSCKFPDIK
jgi:hypothetical protein